MIAIQEARQNGLLTQKNLSKNIISGIVVGVVALPLAMAFAIASGAKPEQGIYTAIVAGLAVSLFGGSRVQVAGPTGAFIVILAGITAKHGFSGLQMATFMAGLILLTLGTARLGSVIKFIPHPVIVGFTAGIGVIIWVGQWQQFFGLPVDPSGHFHAKVLMLLSHFPELNPATTGLAIVSLFLVLVTPKVKWLHRIPGPLVALVVATVAQSVFQFKGVATIDSTFGGIPTGLPPLKIPHFTLYGMLELIGPAFAIAMLGAIESLLSAVVADGMTGQRHNANQELIGQGLANILTPLFGGFAATGAIARTATNIRNGGNSPLAGIIHALTLVLVLLVFAPLAAGVPLCALAAILFVVAYNMSEWRHFSFILRRAPRADTAILLLTFFLTVFADLVVAVNIGVIVATLHFLHKMSSAVDVHPLEEGEVAAETGLTGGPPPGVLIYAIEGPFFFGAVENFERALAHTNTDPETLVIQLKRVPFVDITGVEVLGDVIKKLSARGVKIYLCEANALVKAGLVKAKLLHETRPWHYYNTLPETLQAIRNPPEPDTPPAPPALVSHS